MGAKYTVLSLTEMTRPNGRGGFENGYIARFRTAGGTDGSVVILSSELDGVSEAQAKAYAEKVISAKAAMLDAIKSI